MAAAAIALTGCKSDDDNGSVVPQGNYVREMISDFYVTQDFLDFYSVKLEYAVPGGSTQQVDATWVEENGMKAFKFLREVNGSGLASMQLLFERNTTPVDENREYNFSMIHSGGFQIVDQSTGSVSFFRPIGQESIVSDFQGTAEEVEARMQKRVAKFGEYHTAEYPR